MAVVIPAPPALTGDLPLYHTTDPLLSNSPVLVFHGPAATIGATSSRIQVHIFTPAGCVHYARLAVSPTSPFYSVVNELPREVQGDEVWRGIAFALKKYFSELPEHVKKTWCVEGKGHAPTLWGDHHVAILAARMTRIENVDEVVSEIQQGFGAQKLPWLGIDVVLPPGSSKAATNTDHTRSSDLSETQGIAQRYGKYAELIDSFGDCVFMPTSKLKRAPSKPTTVGRTASFLKHQKENVRQQVNELLDTEDSYVARVAELQEIADKLSLSESAADANLSGLFPRGISDIVRLHADFLTRLKEVVESTQAAAQQDIEAMTDAHPTALQSRQDFVADTVGVGAIADCLSEWFPRFGEPYRLYLQDQASCTAKLQALLKSGESSVTELVKGIGEQKLTSLLIEPVQRLPRYNLYIDSIINQLPARHPAIKPLLRARDVVTEICESDNNSTGPAAMFEKLKTRVSGYPEAAAAPGRLVTAADFIEQLPPYGLEGCDAILGIMLVFTHAIVLLEKREGSTVTAKTLLAELESGRAPLRHAQGLSTNSDDLSFIRQVHLDDVEVLEGKGSRCVHLLTSPKPESCTGQPPSSLKVDSYQTLRLEGGYDRKAMQFIEDITKARLEGRFSEAERESPKWEVRASDPVKDSATLLSTIFEDSNPEHVAARTSRAQIRVIVDIDRHSNRPRANESGPRTVVSVSPLRDGLWRLSFDSVDGVTSQEHVALSDVVTVVRRRLMTLLGSRFGVEQPRMTSALLSRNAKVLCALDLHAALTEDESPSKAPQRELSSSRPKSPVKFLSSFLSSTGPGSQPPMVLKKDLPPLPPPTRLPSVQSNSSAMQPPSRESRPASRDQPTPGSLASMRSTELLNSPLKKLEATLNTYLLALGARKGNIVGRSLKMRATADEAAINELYNSLLENPAMMVLAAEATVDVLFAAFEKFLNAAWREHIGQVLPYPTLQDVQAKAESMFPSEFDQYFKATIGQLPPQNQRAFSGILKLLADLLDGTGNDGDRGTLTAAFAEILVTEGNPHDYIALIDRFVDDPDTYFGESLEDIQKATEGSTSPHKRARSVNSASITSNTSSLRRKFGFGALSRENSKSEQESKVTSVWRTLSKSTRVDASPAGSISKGTLHRSYSTDTDARPGIPSRPVSQDGSPSHKTNWLGDESFSSGFSSALNLGLSTIGEHPSFIPTQPPRKKRRSSLSDLKALNDAQQKSPTPAWSPGAARRPPLTQRYMEDKSLPNSPMPSTPSSKGGSGRFGSPSREPARSRLPSSFRKENSPSPSKSLLPTPERPKSSGGKLDEVVITARPTSNIPTLTPKPLTLHKPNMSPPPRTGLSERPGAGNIVKKPSPKTEKTTRATGSSTTETGSPRKLRMQSPQKLRERLQNESTAIAAAHSSLQDELSKIGDELTSTPSRIGSIRTPNTHARTKSAIITGSGGGGQSTMDLAQRILKLEGQLPSTIDTLNARISAIQSDLATSLSVSESKCKELDELYREANSENEALYARFNEELGRVLRAVKGGEGVEECRKKLAESQEEVASLKRELGRVKRENVGLRAQLRE